MASRRMFTDKIIESDAFLEMPLSTQALYFHYCMNADDDGFVANPTRIQRMIGAAMDDDRVLLAKGFMISFETGIKVVKHWLMHNLIRKDRYRETVYLEEKSMLYVKDNGSYTVDKNQGAPALATKWQPNGNQRLPQYSIGKDSIGKDSIGEDTVRKKERNIEKEISNTVCAHAGEEPLKSHEDIMNEWGLKGILKDELRLWLKSCYNKGHLVLNEQLENVLFDLIEKYGENYAAMCDVVRNATESGYIRIKV